MLGWGSASFVILFVISLCRLIMHASSGSSCSVGLRIEGRSTEEFESGRTSSGLGSPATVVVGVLPVGYLPPRGQDKGKISEIRYPYGSEYLRVALRYADVVGPSRVEPSYAKTFATRYGPPSGVRIWCPDLLMSYVVPVPKMVYFFEAALRTIFASLCTPSSKVSYIISMYVPVPALSQFLGRLGRPSGFFQG